jgi:hypothetical protein
MTPADYDALYLAQTGKCRGCERHQSEFKKRLYVDHDHNTGAVRGLLCHSCNVILGAAQDNTKTLTNLISYLQPNSGLADQSNIISFRAVKKVVG